ncbi:MAG: alpha/beta fold hydrolase [Afipia sp.]|jgi:dienelactone hydrolase|nr:alpha/beta fold hydrolase [Afipia sp.]
MTGFGWFRALMVLVVMAVATPAWAEPRLGAQGGEGAPHRRQDWLVPTQDPLTLSRAVLFRPAGNGPFRLAVIAHASIQNRLRRAQMPQPDYPGLTSVLVARGFAVLVPQRPGHGATGGPYLEDQEGCDGAQYGMSARTTADTIMAALDFMRTQPFVRKDAAIVVGHSAGGWGALALATESPRSIAAIVAFAPGRGGRADDRPGNICAPERLIAAAKELGDVAEIPVTWLVADNDSYFPPEFSQRMAAVFAAAGDSRVDFRVLPPFASEGHWLAEAGDAALLDPLIAGVAGARMRTPEVSAKKKP